MTPDPSWESALRRAAAVRVILVLGETDAGKTSFTAYLANGLLASGLRVGVVDADLGQSDIGPPTTVGLGLIRQPVERLGEAEVAGLYFVGSTSPQGHLLPTVIGTKRMVEKAFALGVDRVIVDTSGLIQGELGRTLKQHKIDLVDPDLLCCLQRGDECEPILKAYAASRRPEVLRLAPGPAGRKRSQEERRQYRERTLQAYFHDARTLHLDLGRVILRRPALFVGQPLQGRQIDELSGLLNEVVLWAERRGSELILITPYALTEVQVRQIARRFDDALVVNYGLDDFQDALAGVESADRETVGLGVVRSLDFVKQLLVIETAVPEGSIASVAIGRQKFRPA